MHKQLCSWKITQNYHHHQINVPNLSLKKKKKKKPHFLQNKRKRGRNKNIKLSGYRSSFISFSDLASNPFHGNDSAAFSSLSFSLSPSLITIKQNITWKTLPSLLSQFTNTHIIHFNVSDSSSLSVYVKSLFLSDVLQKVVCLRSLYTLSLFLSDIYTIDTTVSLYTLPKSIDSILLPQ